MKIAIDIQTTLGQKTGFGNYTQNLVGTLQKVDKTNQYILIRPGSEKDLSTPLRFWWDQVKVPRAAKKVRADILHQPCFSAPLWYQGKVIVTCHDLIALLFGKDIPFVSRLFFGQWMPYSYKGADRIIAVSESTKKDLIKLLKIPEEKIKVIPEAAGEHFKPVKEKKLIEKVRRKYGLGKNYILHVGTLNPRKNLEFLIDVFAEIVKKNPNLNLVITGKKGWYYEGMFRLVRHFTLEGRVKFTGYVDDSDAPTLYSGALLFAFPSLYEGFGLPPLEAMSCGVPVISSNTSSMPEIIGEAGILINPKDKKGWVRAILNVLGNPGLQKEMIKKGLIQAEKFSWEDIARKTISVYERVCSNENRY